MHNVAMNVLFAVLFICIFMTFYSLAYSSEYLVTSDLVIFRDPGGGCTSTRPAEVERAWLKEKKLLLVATAKLRTWAGGKHSVQKQEDYQPPCEEVFSLFKVLEGDVDDFNGPAVTQKTPQEAQALLDSWYPVGTTYVDSSGKENTTERVVLP